MKSPRLTNMLLVVIAVGTIGNFFQGQALTHPAQSQTLGGKPIPVYLVNGSNGDYSMAPTSKVGLQNHALKVMLVDPRGHPVLLGERQKVFDRPSKSELDGLLRGLLEIADTMVAKGLMTRLENIAYRSEVAGWVNSLTCAGDLSRSEYEQLTAKFKLIASAEEIFQTTP